MPGPDHAPTARYAPVPPGRELTVRSADGTAIHIEEYGAGAGTAAPVVVLIHGWTCSTHFWAPVVRELADDGIRVIAYDQRGHGRSGVPGRGGYSTDALADDLAAVLDAVLGAGERAVLVGHSMGGMTAMAAADRPEIQVRTAAVLLASTGSGRLVADAMVLPARVRSPRVRGAFARLMLISALPLGPVTPLTRAAFKYAVLAPGATPEQVAATARIVHACGRRPRAAWGRVLARLDLDVGVTALRAPTAVLVGTADKLTPPVHAHGIAARLPHCVGLTELPGLGHMTPLEDSDAVAGVIRRLIQDHLPVPPSASAEAEPAAEGGTA